MILAHLNRTGAVWGAILTVIAVYAIWMRVTGISTDPAGVGVLVWAVGALIAVAIFNYRSSDWLRLAFMVRLGAGTFVHSPDFFSSYS